MAVFTDILNQGRQSKERPGFMDSRDWYREKAREVMNANPQRIITGNPQNQRGGILPGYLYLFSYDAKLKDTLPYYDRFPLVFPFKQEGDSFLGMNLHYLPHMYRARLMDALYDLTNNERYNERTRLQISYELLNNSSKYKYFKPCIKRYLASHVESRFLLIPSNEWDIALFLPLERFTVNNSTVYADSLKKIRNL